MSQWYVKKSTLVILGCLTFLMLLILVLPDVDLPDTAFHSGTAPVVVHAQVSAPPIFVSVATVVPNPDINAASGWQEAGAPMTAADPNFRPIFLRSIRC